MTEPILVESGMKGRPSSSPPPRLGDTQILPSQILANHLEDRWPRFGAWNHNSRQSQTGSDTNDTGARTYATGDTGHVNLIQANNTQGERDGEDAVDDDGSSDELVEKSQDHTTAVTSPPFLWPTTPALAGQKRDRFGNTMTNTMRTPATDLAAAFGHAHPAQNFLGLSQVFNQTQADSSPYPNHLRSDPIFERPSPDMRVPQLTSPPLALSSPVRFMRGLPTTATSDPRKAYQSMKDSQDRRLQNTLMSKSSPITSEDEDELGEDSEQRRQARRRSRESRLKNAMKEFASFTAPADASRLRSRKKLLPHHLDLERTAKEGREVVVISDDVHEDEAIASTNLSDSESIDEYDEYSQALVRSDDAEKDIDDNELEEGVDDGGVMEDSRTVDSPIEVNVELPRAEVVESIRRAASSPNHPTQSGSLRQSLQPSFQTLYKSQSSKSSSEAWGWPRSQGSQTMAVLDSQPMTTIHMRELMPQSHPVMPSSITSHGFLSESQGFSLSSTTRVELTALPMPRVSNPSDHIDNQQLAQRTTSIHIQDPLCIINSSPPVVVSSAPQLETSRGDVGGSNLDVAVKTGLEKTGPALEIIDALQEHRDQTTPASHGSQPSTADAPRTTSQLIPETSPAATSMIQSAPYGTSAKLTSRRSLSSQQHIAPHAANIQGHNTLNSNHTEKIDDFATAQTHPRASNSNSAAKPNSSVESTPPRRRFRKMTDISNGLSPPKPVGEDFIDANILDQDDLDFHETMMNMSPTNRPIKRPRRTYGRRLRSVYVSPTTTKTTSVRSALQSPAPSDVHTHDVVAPATPPSCDDTFNDPVEGGTTNNIASAVATALVPAHKSPTLSNQVKVTRSTRIAADNAPLEVTAPRTRELDSATETASGVIEATTVIDNTTPIASSPSHNFQVINIPTADETKTTRFPERVLAKFRGTWMAYYPATCLGSSTVQPAALRIRFDDGTLDDVELKYVMHFDLRKGDFVKLDMKGLKQKTWIVRDFKGHISPIDVGSEDFPKTDIYGNFTISISAKTRQSLNIEGDGDGVASETYDVPLANIYIPINMTSRFKDRFIQQSSGTLRSSRLDSPSNAASTPTTPSSRSCRPTINAPNGAIDPEVLNNLLASRPGIFSNMAFAISYSPESETDRNRVRRLLQNNGARILNEGFDELFDVPQTQIVSPSKSARTTDAVHGTPLTLLSDAASLGFTALIADAHSRRAKYMQALALNLPCLSGRWIIDSAEQCRILPWERYLLPAGESSFLKGAIRSRTFLASQPSYYDPLKSTLCETIEHRPKMLAGKNVMLIMGEGKADEKRKAYLFLTLALGAERIQRVKGISAAKTFLQQDTDQWHWLYVGDAKLSDARRELRGLVSGVEEPSKKRKRGNSLDMEVSKIPKKAKLIGDEFVIQSLILGALLEHE